MRLRSLLPLSMLFAAAAANAQSAASHIEAGDRDYAALDALSAFREYEAAVAADPGSYEALWKAARSAVDRAIFDEGGAVQQNLYAAAEGYARRAVTADSADAEGHFHLARALGARALSVGVRQRVRFATEVREQALDCLAISPRHAGCLHVMAVWNAEAMRLNGLARLFARNFLGGRVLAEASWANAQSYIEAAMASEPTRIIHFLDAGGIYRDLDQKEKARQMYETALKLPLRDYNDRHYQAQAQAALRSF